MNDIKHPFDIFHYDEYTINGFVPEPKTYKNRDNWRYGTAISSAQRSAIISIVARKVMPFFYLLKSDVTEIAGGYAIGAVTPAINHCSDLDIVTVDKEFVNKLRKEVEVVHEIDTHTLYVFVNPTIHVLDASKNFSSTHQFILECFDMLNVIIGISNDDVWCPFINIPANILTMNGLDEFEDKRSKDRIIKYAALKGFVPDMVVRDWIKEEFRDEYMDAVSNPVSYARAYQERSHTYVPGPRRI